MSEEKMNYLESIIKTWLNTGAQCSSSLKPYTRSLYPTYNQGIRTKRAHRRVNHHNKHKSKTKKRSKRTLSVKSNRNSMIHICEDFLRNHRELLDI
ncbi:hypothetical protein I4U23_028621 [Adineta vaga]|nr:hypothetical protein I4U23_028621 [Adineta vaga]